MRTYAVSKAVQISATGFEPLEEQKNIPASELPIAPLNFGVISSSAVWLFEWALPLYTPLSPPPAGQVIHSTGRARLLAEGGRVPPEKKRGRWLHYELALLGPAGPAGSLSHGL